MFEIYISMNVYTKRASNLIPNILFVVAINVHIEDLERPTSVDIKQNKASSG